MIHRIFKNGLGSSTPAIIAIIAVLLVVSAVYAYTAIDKNTNEQDDQSMESIGGGEAMSDDSAENDKMMDEGDAMMNESDTQTFDIDASNFKYSMSEIRVRKGEKVVINLNIAEGFHDWKVDEFNAQTSQARAGNIVSVEFIADKAGTFEYYCSVGNHRAMGMVGKLIVE